MPQTHRFQAGVHTADSVSEQARPQCASALQMLVFQLEGQMPGPEQEGTDTKGPRCRLGMQAPGPWGGSPQAGASKKPPQRWEDLITLDLVGDEGFEEAERE